MYKVGRGGWVGHRRVRSRQTPKCPQERRGPPLYPWLLAAQAWCGNLSCFFPAIRNRVLAHISTVEYTSARGPDQPIRRKRKQGGRGRIDIVVVVFAVPMGAGTPASGAVIHSGTHSQSSYHRRPAGRGVAPRVVSGSGCRLEHRRYHSNRGRQEPHASPVLTASRSGRAAGTFGSPHI
jgi:hypothetical protein